MNGVNEEFQAVQVTFEGIKLGAELSAIVISVCMEGRR